MRNQLTLNVETPRRRRRILHRPEQAFHIQLVDLLNLILPKGSFFMHYPAGGQRSPIEAAIFKRMAVRAGVPDIVIAWDGRGFGLELKSDKGSLSSEQHETHAALRKAGWRVEVARSIDEAVRCLDEFGIPLRLAEDDDMLVRARRAA